MADRLELVLVDQDQELIYRFALDEKVFERFYADAWFAGVRAGKVDWQESWIPQVRAVYVENGPVTSGFAVRLRPDRGRSLMKSYSIQVFQPLVQRLAPELVRRGLLSPGASFNYLLLGEPDGQPADVPQPRKLLLPTPVKRPAGFFAKGAPENGSLPVRLAPQVLEAALTASRASPDEVGGALIGHLCLSQQQWGIEIAAQVPAGHVDASSHSLTFTARTWKEIWEAIKTRQQGESLLGWWHSHPFAHPQPQAAGAAEPSPNLFLSEDDLFLHETCFASLWQVALVVDPQAKDSQASGALFGWQEGNVQRIGFLKGGTRPCRANG